MKRAVGNGLPSGRRGLSFAFSSRLPSCPLRTFTRLIVSFSGFLQLSLLAFGQTSNVVIAPAFPMENGLVVERVAKNMQAEAAGLRPGDILLNGKRGSANGELESPCDLPHIWFEQASRGPVTIEGIRRNRRRTWVLGA